jgi:methyl-accepting chemotaxis protein
MQNASLSAPDITPLDAAQLLDMLSRWLESVNLLEAESACLRQELHQSSNQLQSHHEARLKRFLTLTDDMVQRRTRMQNAAENASRLLLGNEDFSAQQLSALFSGTLSDAMNKILLASKNAMKMVYLLDEAITSLASIDRYVGDIQKINKQAKMLAINASIEALRAGEMGEGFSLVAEEVKRVSEQVQTLAQSMQGRISTISHKVAGSYDLLKEVATTDIESNLLSQEKLTKMVQLISSQYSTLQDVLQEAAEGMERSCQELTSLSHEQAPEPIHALLSQCDKQIQDARSAFEAIKAETEQALLIQPPQ